MDPAVRWSKLLQHLTKLESQAARSLRQADLLEDKSEYHRVLQRNATSYRVYGEILQLMEDLENGTVDPNKVADILGADPYKEEEE